MKKLKIEGTSIDMIIYSCEKCPLLKEVGPCGETWHDCSITGTFAGYEFPNDCPLPEVE